MEKQPITRLVDTGRPTSIQAFVEDLKVANNV
jgi:hypothetical protein